MKRWWRAWSDLVLRLASLAGSVASLVGLLVAFLPSPKDLLWWEIALLVVAPIFLSLFVVLEFLDRRSRRVYAKTDTNGIKRYMHDWIEHGGRVAIWTRDMSWAHDRDTRSLLKQKAARGELILCLPARNDLARELESAGAEVCVYGTNLLETPASRSHVIDEFNCGAHPAFYLAEDLVSLVRRQCAAR